MIVKPPGPHPFAQRQEFDSVAGVAAMGHHAVERCEMLVGLPPFAAVVSNADQRTVTNRKGVGSAGPFTGPLAFDLDFRVAREFRTRVRPRQAEINGIAIIVS